MKSTLALAGAIFGLGLLAAACGGDGEGVSISPIATSSPVATATPAQPTAQPTGQPTEEGTATPVQPTGDAESPVVDEYEGWETYTNEMFGYTLKYPGDAEIIGADLDATVDFLGPLVDNERWPWLTVSHLDGDFYHPPAGADIYEWVTESIPYDEIGPDYNVAGIPTVHLVDERSPQAYASDRYYFVKDGQLFVIMVLHAGDQEDWDLYNKFLKSFTFP